MINTITIYCDGGCAGNGTLDSKAYGSFKVYGSEGEINNDDIVNMIMEGNNPKGIFDLHSSGIIPLMNHNHVVQTNNSAEAYTLLLALNYVAENYKQLVDTKEEDSLLVIFSDSELIINQALKIYKVKNKQLASIMRHIHQRLEFFKSKKLPFDIMHVSGNDMKLVLGH